MLVDYYHASEHLSSLAEALFGKSSQEADDWYKKWRHKLKYEPHAVDGLLRSSSRYRQTGKLSEARKGEIEKEETYFRRNRQKMNYHEYVAVLHKSGQWDTAWNHYRALGGYRCTEDLRQPDKAA